MTKEYTKWLAKLQEFAKQRRAYLRYVFRMTQSQKDAYVKSFDEFLNTWLKNTMKKSILIQKL